MVRRIAHGDVSIRFNGKNDNVVFALNFVLTACVSTKYLLSRHDTLTYYSYIDIFDKYQFLSAGTVNNYNLIQAFPVMSLVFNKHGFLRNYNRVVNTFARGNETDSQEGGL